MQDYRRKAKGIKELSDHWLANEEPKYRHYKTYPPDWSRRKLFVQKRDNYTCQICKRRTYVSDADTKRAIDTKHHSMWTGMHVHHKRPLSAGGDNSLDNLITLCESCHENQHPHMLKLKIEEYRQKARRARNTTNIARWSKLANDAEVRLKTARNIYYDK